MGTRYSDRFFGPYGVMPDVPTEPGTINIVALGQSPADAPPQPADSVREPRPWHTHPAARAALAGALLAGAGGVFAWDRWHGHQVGSAATACSDGAATDFDTTSAAFATGRTAADRTAAWETFDVSDDSGSPLDQQCARSYGTGDYSGLYAEVTRAEAVGNDAVAATISLSGAYSARERASPQTYNVVASGSGFSTSIDHTADEAGFGSAVVRVVWTVRDCTQALAATDVDMSVELTGQLPAEPTASTLTSLPSTALTVALTRLSEHVCGAVS